MMKLWSGSGKRAVRNVVLRSNEGKRVAGSDLSGADAIKSHVSPEFKYPDYARGFDRSEVIYPDAVDSVVAGDKTSVVAEKSAPSSMAQRNIIDFESLLAWYNEQNVAEAAGNESNASNMFARKRTSLKFLSL